MTPESAELRLHREVLLWRGVVLLVLLMNLSAEFWANYQRAQHWNTIETTVKATHDNLRACTQCHIHPDLGKFWQDPK